MARSLKINDLVRQPDEARDGEWEKAFFQSIIESRLTILDEAPQMGPDGWPYLQVSTDPSGEEPGYRLMEWLATRGIGLVVNPVKSYPDYVFTYGMIWNYKERGQFLSPLSEEIDSGPLSYEAGEEVVAGAPTDEYLPKYVRQVIGEFLGQQGIRSPKIIMLGKDAKNLELCFSLESLGNPKAEEHQGVAEALAWFLPAHYCWPQKKDFPTSTH